MINLDPSIIDQEGLRKKRRKKLLIAFIAPVAIFAIAGMFFLRPGVFDVLYRINYDGDNSDALISLSQMQKAGNIIEPYIAYYDAGTAYLKDGDGIKAEVELRESIKQQPPADKICQVRTNLSYSIEIQADEAKIMKKYDEALVLFSRAEGILYEDNCANKQSDTGKDRMAVTAKKRLIQKRNSVVSEMNNSADESEIDPETGGLEISDEQMQQVLENIQNGNDIRSDVRMHGRSYGSYGGASGSYGYHW